MRKNLHGRILRGELNEQHIVLYLSLALELFRYIESKFKYICFVSIDVAIYDMQIVSYDANLCFFMDKITIYVIIQHSKLLSMCFLL